MSKTREQLKVTQEKLPGSQLGLEIEISPERSQAAYEQTVTHFMKSAHIPGFRKGKVPRQVVLQRYGAAQLKAATLEDLVEKTFKEAIDQEEIDALGNFQLRSSFEELLTQFEPGAALTYQASIDVQPEAALKKYTQFQITAEEVKYDPSRVDAVIDEQRANRATLIPVEGRAAAAGDVAVIDFSGHYFLGEDKTDPQEIEGGTATDFQVELSEGQLIPGFVEGIIGMNPDETKELELQFPEGYFQEDLSGKTAVFTVTLRELKTKELPELDDNLAQDISEFDTLAELRQFLEDRYQKEAQEKTQANIEAKILEALVGELEVDLPETIIANEVSFLVNRFANQLQSQGLDVKKLFTQEWVETLRERYRDEAIARVKGTLALAEVAQKESITVPREEIETRCKELLAEMDDPRRIDPKRLKEVVEDELLHSKVLDWLRAHSNITLVDEIEEPETVEAVAETVEEAATVPETIDIPAEVAEELPEAGSGAATASDAAAAAASEEPKPKSSAKRAKAAPEEEAPEEPKKTTRRRTTKPKTSSEEEV